MDLIDSHANRPLMTTAAMPLIECLKSLVRDNRLLEGLDCELTLRDGTERLYPFQLLLRASIQADHKSAMAWSSNLEQEANICRSIHPEMYEKHNKEIQAASHTQDILEVGFLVLAASNKRIPIVLTKSVYVTAI